MLDFQLSDALNDICPIITVIDSKGLVNYVNRVAPGVDINKFIGSNMLDWLPEKTSKILRNNIKKVAETKAELTYEVDFIDPTGLTHFYANRMTPLIKHNEVYGITIVTHEITELRNIKKQLERSQTVASLSFDSLEIGVWDWDIKKRKIHWDDTSYKIYGWDKADFDNSFESVLRDIIHPDDLEKFMYDSNYAIENKVAHQGEFRFIRRNDKQVRWANFKSKLFVNEDNEVVRFLGVSWDVTEYKEREETRQKGIELERRNNELKEFAYLASHDLKAPLRTLQSYSELLFSRYKDKLDQKANMYLQFINEASVELDNQIRELLNYSLVGQHKDKDLVDCNILVDKILAKLSFGIKESETNVVVETLPKVYAYATDISLLFQNLISNAVKFQSKSRKPALNITAQQIGDFWEFEIRDNGIGIDEKHLTKIFSIFERLHTKEEFEGTGIGLAHCRKIVEFHEGKIWAESKLGIGSSFFFTIKNTTSSKKLEH